MAGRHMLRLARAGRPALCTMRSTAVTSHNMVRTTLPQTAHKILCTASFHSSQSRYNEHIINIQDEDDFKKRVLDNEAPVVIDFHAEWCGPCKILGPRLEALVGDKEGKVILAKVDIDTNTDLAMHHGVQAVPTVLAMKGGKVVDKFVGVQDDTHIQSFINGLTGE